MRLVEKLRRITAPAGADRVRPFVRAAAELPGEAADDGDGSFWRRRTRFPLAHRHGDVPLAHVAAGPVSGPLARVAREPGMAGVALERAIFFDTETTSLGSGAGTYVFLLGAGWFEGDAFVVEQYFLRDMTEEPALMAAIRRRLGAFDAVVSFYGKGFDVPRLLDRLAFHRMPVTLPGFHLDLCHVGRSLFRGAFPDCRLQTFERELVRFRRTGDLPGAECPQAFFRHLQGDSSLIPRVFEHNLYDVLTLPAVLHRFAAALDESRHPVVLANLGVFHESTGDDREARACYTGALAGLRAARHPLLARTLERLALLDRRAGRHAESAALLQERNRLAPFAFQPLEDLAKYFEHRARDLERAHETVLDARSRLLTGKIEVTRAVRERHLRALDHRLGRLRRRLERA